MKTKTLKTVQLWMLVLVLAISSSTVLTSCSKDDNYVPKPEQPLVLKGEAAVAWTRAHLDSLVNVYMADCGNLLDPT